MIKRLIQKELNELLRFSPVVGILGPRQVGKTTIAKLLVEKQVKAGKAIYLDLELHSDQMRLTDSELFLKKHENQCVVIDEVQRMPELFPLIRSLVDQDRKPGRFLLLGSASPVIVKEASDSLAGRVIYKELGPFNIIEVLGEATVLGHWMYGGFPAPLLTKKVALRIAWLDSFIQSYVERDLPEIGLNLDSKTLYKFWSMLAHYHGGVWNASDFGRAMGVSHTTVNRYLDFMEAAFLITRLQPFWINTSKRLVKSPKIYLRDSGLLHRLNRVSTFDELESTTLIGASWEGYVIEQIRLLKDTAIDMYFYRTQSGAECDLVLAKGQSPIACVEIKYSVAPKLARGFYESLNDTKSKHNYVIVPGEKVDYLLKENLRVVDLITFLKKYLKKL